MIPVLSSGLRWTKAVWAVLPADVPGVSAAGWRQQSIKDNHRSPIPCDIPSLDISAELPGCWKTIFIAEFKGSQRRPGQNDVLMNTEALSVRKPLCPYKRSLLSTYLVLGGSHEAWLHSWWRHSVYSYSSNATECNWAAKLQMGKHKDTNICQRFLNCMFLCPVIETLLHVFI